MMKSINDDKNILHIGFDDTDSRYGRCTTHLAFKIVSNLKRNYSINFLDYPLLVRLNPNIPWKTRGNGAICIRLRTDNNNNIESIMDDIRNELERCSYIGNGANPGLVFLEGLEIPNEIKEFYRFAMFDILSKQKALKIVEKKNNMKYFAYGNGQGLVGATAALGCILESDFTFEVIAYRKSENLQTSRKIDVLKVIDLDRSMYPYTFNCYDYIHKRVLIAPHGPDPVFCGIRGEDPKILLNGLKMLEIKEKLEGYLIYRTNQGTGMHLNNKLELANTKTYTSGFSRCKVVTNPYTIEGGHVLFAVIDNSDTCLAAVYEPTGLTKIASQLHIGDFIEIGFGVRKATSKHTKVLNIEYILILKAVNIYELINPDCKNCGKRMKSEGKNKGFQCKRCKTLDRYGEKVKLLKPRTIKEDLYIPNAKAQRHLTKPLHRYGMEKNGWNEKTDIFLKWFEIFV